MATPTINMSIEEQKTLLAKLLADKQKQADRAKEYRERNKDKCNEWSERARIRAKLLCDKAKLAGLTVSGDEIDDYLAKR